MRERRPDVGRPSSYDDADRLADAGYVYDAFGRTLKVPGPDAGGGELRASYYLNDRVHSLTQDERGSRSSSTRMRAHARAAASP